MLDLYDISIYSFENEPEMSLKDNRTAEDGWVRWEAIKWRLEEYDNHMKTHSDYLQRLKDSRDDLFNKIVEERLKQNEMAEEIQSQHLTILDLQKRLHGIKSRYEWKIIKLKDEIRRNNNVWSQSES